MIGVRLAVVMTHATALQEPTWSVFLLQDIEGKAQTGMALPG